MVKDSTTDRTKGIASLHSTVVVEVDVYIYASVCEYIGIVLGFLFFTFVLFKSMLSEFQDVKI